MTVPCYASVQETQEERSLRTRVFVQGAFRWYVSIVGFVVFFVIGCIAIPHIFSSRQGAASRHLLYLTACVARSHQCSIVCSDTWAAVPRNHLRARCCCRTHVRDYDRPCKALCALPDRLCKPYDVF